MTARMGQSLDQSQGNGVADIDKDQWNGGSSGVHRSRGRAPQGDDDLWTRRHQLSGQRRNLLVPALVVTIIDLQIGAVDPAMLAQSIQPNPRRLGIARASKDPNAMNRLFRTGTRRRQSKANRRCSE